MLGAVAARAAQACDLLGVPEDEPRLLVACSGGADSGATLLLIRHARRNVQLFACYLDHGLRPPADIKRDISAVRAQARASNARVLVERLPGGASPNSLRHASSSTSVEARAREFRYETLLRVAREVGARFVITGHQRDDLVESTLLALTRGAGIDGVAAMRPRRPLGRGVDLVRPLLWASKEQLEAVLASQNIPHALDATNADLRLRRNSVRALVRELEMVAPGTSGAIARGAALLREDQVLLQDLTAQAWHACRANGGSELSVAKLRALPRAMLRRVIRHAVREVQGNARDFHFSHCDAVARAILERRGGRFHAGATSIVLSAGRLMIGSSAHVEGPAVHELVVPSVRSASRTPWGTLTLTRGPARKGALALDAKRFPPGTKLHVRQPRVGDKIVPAGHSRPVPLARFLAKAGVPNPRRGAVPLLCKGDTIVAVLGMRPVEPFAARGGGNVLSVALNADNTKE